MIRPPRYIRLGSTPAVAQAVAKKIISQLIQEGFTPPSIPEINVVERFFLTNKRCLDDDFAASGKAGDESLRLMTRTNLNGNEEFVSLLLCLNASCIVSKDDGAKSEVGGFVGVYPPINENGEATELAESIYHMVKNP